jgi:putative copper export protein/methionine-rich copper-binding protein CopC
MLAFAADRTSSRRPARGQRVLVGLALAIGVVLATAGPASAHTDLASSVPVEGATVEALSSVELRFTEPIDLAGSHVWVADIAGTVELSPVANIDGDDTTLTAPVPADLAPDGAYELTYHVLATDGMPAEGSVSFFVTPPALAPTAPTEGLDPAADPKPDGSLAIPVGPDGRRPGSAVAPEVNDGDAHGPSGSLSAFARGLLDASLATLVGGLAFVATVWPQGARLARTRQVLWFSALLAAVASFELVAIQHATASGIGTFEALLPWNQLDALDFRYGRIAAARVVLLAGSAVLTARLARGGARTARSSGWFAAAVVVALGLCETVALAGHSSAPGMLDMAARLVHVIAVSTWLGGLVMLLFVVLPRRRVEELVTVLPRFSALATGAVTVLSIGGIVLAVDLVGSAGALPNTAYGRMLLIKVAVVGALLAVASCSRRHVRTVLLDRAGASGESVARPLAVWVSTEVGLLALVLGLTALLVARVPPG